MPHLSFDRVSFCYDTAGIAVFDAISIDFQPGWTGVIGPNGSGKTTLLDLAHGVLKPTAGQIRSSGLRAMVCQRTENAPPNAEAFVHAHDGPACRLQGQLDIGWDWHDRWSTLSHGERKRLQIACALWQRPDILLIDEPTNHLDADARQRVITTLSTHRGIGIIVSHDRALLDELCSNCLFLERPSACVFPGGYSNAMALAEADRERDRRAHEKARRVVKRLESEAANRAHAAAQADAKRSKRGIASKDHDAKARIDAALVSGKDGTAGRRLAQIQGRIDQARTAHAGTDPRKQARLGIAFQGERVRRNILVQIPAGSIELGGGRALEHGELTIHPGDRIGLTGPNGAGKSTLLRALHEAVAIDWARLTFIPQELATADVNALVKTVRDLDHVQLGNLMTIVSRLGSSPEAVMETELPSPGEARKIMLGLGILRGTSLIMLDEPTNHLDLPSIECLESALAECPAALLLISHDQRFLEALVTARWTIADGRIE